MRTKSKLSKELKGGEVQQINMVSNNIILDIFRSMNLYMCTARVISFTVKNRLSTM